MFAQVECLSHVFGQIRVDPWKIYVLVGGILVVDIVVLGAWQGADPMFRKLESFPLEIPEDTDDDVKIKPELEHCESSHNTIWLGEAAIRVVAVSWL